jgi:hypothetical protein
MNTTQATPNPRRARLDRRIHFCALVELYTLYRGTTQREAYRHVQTVFACDFPTVEAFETFRSRHCKEVTARSGEIAGNYDVSTKLEPISRGPEFSPGVHVLSDAAAHAADRQLHETEDREFRQRTIETIEKQASTSAKLLRDIVAYYVDNAIIAVSTRRADR